MNILLIEPDAILSKTYKTALQAAGHRVAACAAGQAAIFLADQQRPDLIIMEIQLIEHSGIEILYELRSYPDWQTIPVIIQSMVPPAEFNRAHSLLFDELKVAAYLYKPRTSLHDLINQVQKFANPVEV